MSGAYSWAKAHQGIAQQQTPSADWVAAANAQSSRHQQHVAFLRF
jgi:hypothetical protein